MPKEKNNSVLSSGDRDKRRIQKYKYWVFTFNNPDLMLDKTPEECFKEEFKYMVYQLEQASTGTLHYQGYIALHERQSLQWLCERMKAHYEKRKGKHAEAKAYCMKSDSRISGPYEFGTDKGISDAGRRTDLEHLHHAIFTENQTVYQVGYSYLTEFLKYGKNIETLVSLHKDINSKVNIDIANKSLILRPWQKEVIEILEEQNDRQVLWVVDSPGGRGKTTLGKYLMATKDAFYVQNGKTADISYAYNNEKYVVLDYTRDHETFVNYSVIESFKNGIIFSPKYTSKVKVFQPAKLVVFSNFNPDEKKLSRDRWVIKDISEFNLV